MEEIVLPAGTSFYVGAPAIETDPELFRGLARGLGAIPNVLEAHLPQFYAEGITETSVLLLCAVVPKAVNLDSTRRGIEDLLAQLLPDGEDLPFMLLQHTDSGPRTLQTHTNVLHDNTDAVITYEEDRNSLLETIRGVGRRIDLVMGPER